MKTSWLARQFRIPTCNECWRPCTDKVRCGAFSSDDLYAVAGFEDGTLRVVCLLTGRLSVPIAEHAKTVTACALVPGGKWVVTGSSDGSVRLGEIRDEAPPGRQVGVHPEEVWGVACAPDGTRCLSCGKDNSLHEWSIPAGERVKSWFFRD